MKGNALTEARQKLAAALMKADLGVTIHTYPPGTINGPCIALYAGDPWLTPRGHVSINVTVYAQTSTNQGAVQRLEQLAWDTLTVLSVVGGFSWGEFSAPQVDQTSKLASCTITTVTRP